MFKILGSLMGLRVKRLDHVYPIMATLGQPVWSQCTTFFCSQKRSRFVEGFDSLSYLVTRMATRMFVRSLRSKLLPMFTPAVTLNSHATSFGVARSLRCKLLPMFTPASTLHYLATIFGYEDGKENENIKYITVEPNCEDYMNDLLNGGLYRLWEDRLVLRLNPFPGIKHLHVAGGTSDIAFRILETIIEDRGEDDLSKETQIYVCDNNPSMLNFGKKRAQQRGLGDLESLVWIEGDAERLPFEDNSMHGYAIAFDMRNAKHTEKVLAEAYRVLKKGGGRFLCLELCQDCPRAFKQVYDFYSMSDIPALGKMVAGDRDPFEYLVDGVLRFPPKEVFESMIEDAGFQATGYEFLVGGVTIHYGMKL
ncbi:hypothetical protein QVD17_22795 [Tagetes erecta]|uniref:2-methoxy-6-polyprenyl-1,4-benzoquinol methylase, mitochondrial n=1 Tax=Tagetes erecta TaxID=13708 RepID=A0AAD8NLV6_TARER|nr:hypothetical protein QVD17_22795 [Tagetes erecta]